MPLHRTVLLRLAGLLTLAIGSAAPQVSSAPQPAASRVASADSGWKPLWNGRDFTGLFAYVSKQGRVAATQQTALSVDSGMLHATGANTWLVTQKAYSYYRVRVDYRFVPSARDADANGGMAVLFDNDAAKTAVANLRPRSIEINFQRTNGNAWTLWASTGYGPYMTSTIKANSTNQFLPQDQGGVPKALDIESNRILYSALANPELPPGQWNHGEALILGDSGVFYLNGKLRTSSWNWRVKDAEGKMVKAESGGIGIQADGFDMWYRNWEILELNPDGTPVSAHPPPPARRGIRPPRHDEFFDYRSRRLKIGSRRSGWLTLLRRN